MMSWICCISQRRWSVLYYRTTRSKLQKYEDTNSNSGQCCRWGHFHFKSITNITRSCFDGATYDPPGSFELTEETEKQKKARSVISRGLKYFPSWLTNSLTISSFSSVTGGAWHSFNLVKLGEQGRSHANSYQSFNILVVSFRKIYFSLRLFCSHRRASCRSLPATSTLNIERKQGRNNTPI